MSVMPISSTQQEERLATSGRRVMQVTWSLVAGGAETYALTIASGLAARGDHAMMCGIDQGGALEPEITRRGIPFVIMNRRPGIDLRLMWRMYQLFRREHVDVVHTHHFNQLFYSLPGAKLLGIRVIHTEHSIEAYKKPRLRWALRLMSTLCHKVTAIGADGENTLLTRVGIPRKKLTVIRAAVDLSRFELERSAARQALSLSPDDRVATIVARLYPEKNHPLLLRAFRTVVDHLPQARLLIVGEGTERELIERLIAELGLGEHVRVMGVRRDIPLILAASDLFILCSDREGLPIAVLEAMAASRPVVATAVGDLPQVVQHDQTGLLVEAKNPDDLAQAIERVLADDALARRLGEQGRRLVEKQYSLDTMIRRHIELYGPEKGRS